MYIVHRWKGLGDETVSHSLLLPQARYVVSAIRFVAESSFNRRSSPKGASGYFLMVVSSVPSSTASSFTDRPTYHGKKVPPSAKTRFELHLNGSSSTRHPLTSFSLASPVRYTIRSRIRWCFPFITRSLFLPFGSSPTTSHLLK